MMRRSCLLSNPGAQPVELVLIVLFYATESSRTEGEPFRLVSGVFVFLAYSCLAFAPPPRLPLTALRQQATHTHVTDATTAAARCLGIGCSPVAPGEPARDHGRLNSRPVWRTIDCCEAIPLALLLAVANRPSVGARG